jgi:hypothetical protein
MLGAALDLPTLRTVGVASGYTGLSWALPGLVVGLLVDRSAHARGVRLHRPLGFVAGCGSAAVLLVAAAAVIGS